MPETGRGRLTALFQVGVSLRCCNLLEHSLHLASLRPHEERTPILQAMDRDGNGKLDAAEFRDAMKQLGMQNLTGTTVSTIFEAMDIHGAITMEDFLQIVEVPHLELNLSIGSLAQAET